MTHQEHRCKFCGKTYFYQASGVGCLASANDEDYCPRCKEIIDKALNENVPEEDRLKHRPKECGKFPQELLEKMENLKSDYYNGSIRIRKLFSVIDYENIEVYHIGGKIYYILYNDANDKHYFIEYEHCQATGEYKDVYREVGRASADCYVEGYSTAGKLKKMYSKDKMPSPQKMPEPLGKLYYSDWL